MPDVRDIPSVSGTTVRSQSRSALSLPEQDASRGILVATVSNRDGLGIPGHGCTAGDGKNHATISSIAAATAESEDRIHIPYAMYFQRTAEALAI